ncbi:hypothetical protein Angca_002060, partial [Angiostrongylus cantonensis]
FASHCACRDSDGQLHDFCYRLPEEEKIHGLRFSCEHMDSIKDLGLLDTSHLWFTVEDITTPVFVTAFSSNHQREVVSLVEENWRWKLNTELLYELCHTDFSFQKWNFLEFRQFNFTRYPQYVRNLDEFRWKPIIIAEMLKEFSSIWYMDSSIVFKKGDLSHVYELIKCRKYVTHRPPVKPIFVRDLREALTEHESGWDVHQWNQNVDECRKMSICFYLIVGRQAFLSANNLRVGAPEIYKFIPTNFAEIKKPKAKMYDAGFVFAARTRDTIEKIVKWYVLCALEEDCMAGNHREWTYCRFLGDRFSEPPKCHRFDQSVVNLLAANAFYYDRHYYVSEIVDFFNIER